MEALERNGFWDGADFRFVAIDMTNVNKKERERKRQSEKSQSSSNIQKYIECKGRMYENA